MGSLTPPWLGDAGALRLHTRQTVQLATSRQDPIAARRGAEREGQGSPRGQAERRAEARHAPLPSSPESLLNKLALRLRVYAPERALAGLFLRAGHLDEVAV